MPQLLSDELKLINELEDIGTFDPFLDIDSQYFINVKRLKDTKVTQFKDSYKK